jgi:hypothetical protein
MPQGEGASNMHRPRVWCSGVGLGRQSAVFLASNMHRPRVCCGGPLASVAGVRKTSPCEPVPGRGRRFILSARFSEEALSCFFPRPAVRGEGARRAGEGCGQTAKQKAARAGGTRGHVQNQLFISSEVTRSGSGIDPRRPRCLQEQGAQGWDSDREVERAAGVWLRDTPGAPLVADV